VDTLLLEGMASLGTGNSEAVDALYGNSAVASTLVAGSGADLLVVAGTAGTILAGGAGQDTFAFPNIMGHDEVTNFGIAKDIRQFNATLFENVSAAMADATQVGANTVFTIDANDTVALNNARAASRGDPIRLPGNSENFAAQLSRRVHEPSSYEAVIHLRRAQIGSALRPDRGDLVLRQQTVPTSEMGHRAFEAGFPGSADA
jgi:hypothetical protein